MDPLTAALVLGGVGLAKSELIDRPREERQRKQAAITARWSPWTGMSPGQIQEADPFGSALQGGLTGAMLAQKAPATTGADKTKDIAEVSLAGGTTPMSAQPQQFPFQMMETQNQSIDPMLIRRPMYGTRM